MKQQLDPKNAWQTLLERVEVIDTPEKRMMRASWSWAFGLSWLVVIVAALVLVLPVDVPAWKPLVVGSFFFVVACLMVVLRMGANAPRRVKVGLDMVAKDDHTHPQQ